MNALVITNPASQEIYTDTPGKPRFAFTRHGVTVRVVVTDASEYTGPIDGTPIFEKVVWDRPKWLRYFRSYESRLRRTKTKAVAVADAWNLPRSSRNPTMEMRNGND